MATFLIYVVRGTAIGSFSIVFFTVAYSYWYDDFRLEPLFVPFLLLFLISFFLNFLLNSALVQTAGRFISQIVSVGYGKLISTQRMIDANSKERKTGGPELKILSSFFMDSLFNFRGKSTRKQFWLWQIGLAIAIIIAVAGLFLLLEMEAGFSTFLTLLMLLAILVSSLIASYAIATRRLRDAGVNPWWVLLVLVPPINLAALVFMALVPTDEFKGKGF